MVPPGQMVWPRAADTGVVVVDGWDVSYITYTGLRPLAIAFSKEREGCLSNRKCLMDILALRATISEQDLNDLAKRHLPSNLPVEELRFEVIPEGLRIRGEYPL